jgi:hypothetical protein
MRYTVHLRNATIKIQLSAAEHAQVLKHFGQKGQLRIFSGELYAQGFGWYLCFLNEDRLSPEVAARRFLDCLTVALRHGDSIAKRKADHAELEIQVKTFLRKKPRHIFAVDHFRDHGRTVGIVRSFVLQALKNRDSEVTKDIKALLGCPTSVPPQPAALSALVQKFGRP